MSNNILIDGYNLSLEKGTGVATYSRNLSYALKALGYDVSVLYGSKRASGKDPLIKEISFFDPASRQPAGPLRFINYCKETLNSSFGYSAERYPYLIELLKILFNLDYLSLILCIILPIYILMPIQALDCIKNILKGLRSQERKLI